MLSIYLFFLRHFFSSTENSYKQGLQIAYLVWFQLQIRHEVDIDIFSCFYSCWWCQNWQAGKEDWENPRKAGHTKRINQRNRSRYFSMTTLLTHTVAHSTKPSFRFKTNNQPLKKFLSLVLSWAKVIKNWTSF